jgi:hypothetical protein
MLQGGRNGEVSENEMRSSGFDSQHLFAPFALIFMLNLHYDFYYNFKTKKYKQI